MLQTACRNLVRSSFHCLIPRLRRRAITFTLALSVTTFGCVTRPQTWQKTVRNDTTEVDRVTDQIDNPAPTIFHEASARFAAVDFLLRARLGNGGETARGIG